MRRPDRPYPKAEAALLATLSAQDEAWLAAQQRGMDRVEQILFQTHLQSRTKRLLNELYRLEEAVKDAELDPAYVITAYQSLEDFREEQL